MLLPGSASHALRRLLPHRLRQHLLLLHRLLPLAIAGFAVSGGGLLPAPLTAQEHPDVGPASAAGQSPVYAPRGALATSHPLATSAGLRILEEGGNAVDAAVVAAVVLTVVESHMTGLGGDLFALVWPANEGRLFGLSAHGRSGSRMTLEALRERELERIPIRGPEAITVPGSLRGWADLLERFGTLSLADALAPAIRLAEEGFPVSPVVASDWAGEVEVLERDEGARATFLVDGERAPEAGEWFRNPDYAQTLRRIAAEGPEVFYGGDLGREVVEGLEALGAFLTLDDLARHESRWVEPLSADFRGYRLWQIPPPGQGIAALQMLRILEPFPLERMGHNSAEYLHHLIEAKKLAYADLDGHIADPRFMETTPEHLLADGYIAGRRALISPHEAMDAPDPGDAATRSETIYLTVADADGNMISLINSVYYGFGSGIVVPGTGFHLQNRGAGFTMEPDQPNTVAPGKKPFHTIIPGFVTRIRDDGGDDPWVSFGVMGGAMQPQGHVQVLLNMALFGMDPQQAADADRFRHYSGLRVGIEAGVGEEVRRALRARGHDVTLIGPGAVGGAQIIQRLERGWVAGSDPRKDGHAAGH